MRIKHHKETPTYLESRTALFRLSRTRSQGLLNLGFAGSQNRPRPGPVNISVMSVLFSPRDRHGFQRALGLSSLRVTQCFICTCHELIKIGKDYGHEVSHTCWTQCKTQRTEWPVHCCLYNMAYTWGAWGDEEKVWKDTGRSKELQRNWRPHSQ